MKRYGISLYSVLLALFLFGASAVAQAGTVFNFSGVDAGGVGSATMEITTAGTQLTADLLNTSPIYALNGTSFNAPGITGFGFDLSNEGTLVSWTLFAYDEPNTSFIQIGGTGLTGDWVLGTTQAGVTLDYLPQIQGMDGALYNPAAIGGLPGDANKDNYFTQAVLTMVFGSNPSLVIDQDSPYVRMQNVGISGAGSLKLNPVPEPATMLISALTLVGAGGFVRRKFFKQS